MCKYKIRLRANEKIETAINQEIIATFELYAVNRNAAMFRATKMMDYVIEGYIRDKNLHPSIADDGCHTLSVTVDMTDCDDQS